MNILAAVLLFIGMLTVVLIVRWAIDYFCHHRDMRMNAIARGPSPNCDRP